MLIEIADEYSFGGGGNLRIDVSFESVANDDCVTARVIQAAPFHDTLSTCAATRDLSEPTISCGYPDRSHSVWYTYTPPAAGKLDVSTLGSDYSTVIAVFTGTCGDIEPVACIAGSAIACVSVEEGAPVLIEVADATPSGSGGELVFDLVFVPDLVMFWETDPQVLATRLVTAQPSGIQDLEANVVVEHQPEKDPHEIWPNSSIGYYESFGLSDGVTELSAPDGIILTTGLVRRSREQAGEALTCDNLSAQFGAQNLDADSDDIRQLYASPTAVDDEIGLRLTFKSDTSIGGLRFKLILASDEFPEYAPHEPTPADKEEQGTFACFPDTFATFLDGYPVGFLRDEQGRQVLINVAQQVMKLNNNIAPEQDHQVTVKQCGEPLDPERYTPVNYLLEYDGFAAKQTGTGTWEPLTIGMPLRPNDPNDPDDKHTLKIAVADMAPEAYDGVFDTAAFVSALEFIECHCPPQDVNGDTDVDLADFLLFQVCFNGPNREYKSEDGMCFCFDADHDADVDLADFTTFQACFNGPNRPPKCSTAWCGGSVQALAMPAEDEPLQVVFDLRSPQEGRVIQAGTAVDWSVAVRVDGAGAGVAAWLFDLELHQDGDTGPRPKVALPVPSFAIPLSDSSAAWWACGPNARRLGTISGIGDAFVVPWSADSAKRLAMMLTETPTAASKTSHTVSAGSISTEKFAPGRYALVLRPAKANVLRDDVDLADNVVGNFATPARVVNGSTAVVFDVTD